MSGFGVHYRSADNLSWVPASAAQPLPVTESAPTPHAPVDHSGTITNGGASQVAIAANASRAGYLIHNPSSAAEVLQVKFGGGYIDLQPGGTIDSNGLCFSGDITVKAATTGHAFTAYEAT